MTFKTNKHIGVKKVHTDKAVWETKGNLFTLDTAYLIWITMTYNKLQRFPYNEALNVENSPRGWNDFYKVPLRCVRVTIFIRHAKGMRRIILSFVACLVLPYFSAVPHIRYDFQKSFLNIKYVLISSTIYVWNVSHCK